MLHVTLTLWSHNECGQLRLLDTDVLGVVLSELLYSLTTEACKGSSKPLSIICGLLVLLASANLSCYAPCMLCFAAMGMAGSSCVWALATQLQMFLWTCMNHSTSSCSHLHGKSYFLVLGFVHVATKRQ